MANKSYFDLKSIDLTAHSRVVSDVDECEDPAVCGTARCENTDGGYDCLCDGGYVYDNETRTCVGE